MPHAARRPERAGQHKPDEQTTRDFLRVAQTRAASWNAELRTIDVEWTAHGDVRRYDYYRDIEYIERLSSDPAHWDLTRLNNGGCPVLNSHHGWDLGDQIGVVLAGSGAVTTEGGTATIRLSDAPGDADNTRKIATGICRNLSFGYDPSGWVKSIDADGQTEIRTATMIVVYELSFTPIGADAGAMSRARSRRGQRNMKRSIDAACVAACQTAAAACDATAVACDAGDEAAAAGAREICAAACDAAATACETSHPVVAAAATACAEACRTGDLEAASDACEACSAACKACAMDAAEDTTDAGADGGTGAMGADAEAARAAEKERNMSVQDKIEATKTERERSAGILLTCRKLGLPSTRAEELVAGDKTLDQVRALLIDEHASATDESTPVRSHAQIQFGKSHSEQERAGMAGAILHRMNPNVFPLDDAARAHRHMRTGEIARALAGEDTKGMSERDVIERAFHVRSSTSDFPSLLDNVVNKTLLAPYETITPIYPLIAGAVSATDLKRRYPTILSGTTDFEVVPEGTDYPIAVLKEGRESYVPLKRGLMIKLTLEALINDDLSGFDRMPRSLVEASMRAREKAVIALITANGLMSDGVALFDALHKNLVAAGAAPTPASIDALMKLIDLQTGLNDEELSLEGQILLFPRALQQVIEQIYAIRTSAGVAVNSAASILTDRQAKYRLVPSRFLDASSATAFYGLANPGTHPAIEYATLSGREQLSVTRDEWFSDDTVRWKGQDFFGCGTVDFHPIAKNPGA